MLHIREIPPSQSALRSFVKFPLSLYRNDPYYVLPSVEQQVRGLLGRHNAMISNGVQTFLMAYDGETPVGRVLAGIDFRTSQRMGEKQGYVSMFECVDDQNAADALFTAAESALKLNGINAVIGPNPTLFDDFGNGLLLQGFEEAPTFLSPYNPAYYVSLFENAGFSKYHDAFSYDLPLDALRDEKYESVLHRAGKRFGYRVENVDLRRNLKHNLRRRSREFARIIAESTPSEWDVLTPTAETLYRELQRIRSLLWEDYVVMAYAGDRPIGVMVVIPDCNPLLKGLNGHMFPVGTFRTVFQRSYIDRIRSVMLYVVPEYQNKGVELVMISRIANAARENGIQRAEASMVNEQNLKLQLAVERLGGRVSKVYRQYHKAL